MCVQEIISSVSLSLAVSTECLFFCIWMNLIMKKPALLLQLTSTIWFELRDETLHTSTLFTKNFIYAHVNGILKYTYRTVYQPVHTYIQYPVMLSFFPHLISHSLFALISKSTRMYTIRLSITLYYVCSMFSHQRM